MSEFDNRQTGWETKKDELRGDKYRGRDRQMEGARRGGGVEKGR